MIRSPDEWRAADGEALERLFSPFRIGGLTLKNRIIMAPMTRRFSPGGIPTDLVAAYYSKRAQGGVALVMTEGTYVNRASGQDLAVPNLYDPQAVAAWSKVVDAVHAAGARMGAQLWHMGFLLSASKTTDPSIRLVGPSGLDGKGERPGVPMTDSEIADTIDAYGRAARNAKAAGFDAVELHAGHGYLIDQFLWDRTNERRDEFGGDLVGRTRFAVEALKACREAVGPGFPISFRWSQWKIQDYGARLAETPRDMARLLEPIANAGVDVFHCSTRRFWEPEFEGSDLNLAGWTKKLTGKPVITVGSVSLSTDVQNHHQAAMPTDIRALLDMFARDEIDIVAVGRALIANPDWPNIVRGGKMAELAPFIRSEIDNALI
jgi:2,4-dienoyl-CoA reductase-like NADH-dependent reductase (Old Yellow Enzyme family)